VDKLIPRDLATLVGQLTAEDLSGAERGRLLAGLARGLVSGMRSVGAQAALSGRWMADLVVDDVAPHLPVRDLLTLRDHHAGLSGDELARALIRNATRVTAGIGAAAGVVIAAELVAPPTLLAVPVQLVAETLAVVAVEIKLVAELHVVYGKAPVGTRRDLAAAYVTSWASKRSLDSAGGLPALSMVLSSTAKQQVRRRVVRRARRNLTSLVPFLAGAVAAAELNRRETQALGLGLLRDLGRRA
jgi:hypothetical protein